MKKTQQQLLNETAGALGIAYKSGALVHGHHKQWCIDQMVKALTGKDYAKWVKEFEKGEDGPKTYEWDTGIAP